MPKPVHMPHLRRIIGRVKIPAMLKKKYGDGLQVNIVSGTDFPKELQDYDFIIHCGACMFNKKYVQFRVEQAKKGRNTDDELRNCYRIYERDTGAYYILISKIKSECSTHLLDSLQ